MRKRFGIIVLSILMLFFGLFESSVNVYASDIVETEQLPTILTYEELSKLYSCKEQETVIDPAIIELSQEDAMKVMKVAQAEAGEVDPLAIAYVIKLIINRLNSEDFPDTIEGVLTQKGQFTIYKSSEYERTIPNSNTHYALYLVESGQINIQAKFYEAIWVKNSWASAHREFEFEYGGHRFYI